MIKILLKHRSVAILSLIALCFAMGGFLWAYIVLKASGGGPFILHFDDMNGITQVGSLATLVEFGFFGVIATFMNAVLAIAFDERDPLLGKFIASLTLGFAALLFIAFAAILSVN